MWFSLCLSCLEFTEHWIYLLVSFFRFLMFSAIISLKRELPKRTVRTNIFPHYPEKKERYVGKGGWKWKEGADRRKVNPAFETWPSKNEGLGNLDKTFPLKTVRKFGQKYNNVSLKHWRVTKAVNNYWDKVKQRKEIQWSDPSIWMCDSPRVSADGVEKVVGE